MTDPATPANAQPRTFWQALKVYGERRTLVMLGLGFASGLPYLLIFDTLSLWLHESGVSIGVIAFFGLATLSYSLKFFWAPFVDRTDIPVLTSMLGHRRSWMLTLQGLIILGLWLIAGGNPAENLALVAAFAVLVGFISATQDIVIDAWRIEAVEDAKQGAMAAAYQYGWRIAFIVAGALPLIIAEEVQKMRGIEGASPVGWSLAYSVMAVLMGFGILAVLFAPRERRHVVRAIPTEGVRRRPGLERLEWLARGLILAVAFLIVGSGLLGNAKVLASFASPLIGAQMADALQTAWSKGSYALLIQLGAVFAGFGLLAAACWPLPGAKTLPGTYLAHSFGDPLKDFFDRFGGRTGALILALICLYRLSDFVLNIVGPFYLDLGFTKEEVAGVRKVFGVIATSAGIFLGGLAIARWGILGPLFVGALAGPVSNLVFAYLAIQGPQLSALFLAIGVDNVSGGFAGTCLIAYMSSLTSVGFTATQYAFFSSLYSLPGKIIASLSGRVVEGVARNADAGGLFSPLTGLMTGLPATSFEQGAANSDVSPAALGAGYLVFFFYSAAIGALAVVLTLIVIARSRKTAKTAHG